MDILELNVKPRTGKGKSHAKKMRREDRIPGIVYQQGEESISVELNKKEFFHLLQGGHENLLLKLLIEGKGSRTALVSEMQLHPVTDTVLHVDFHGISMKEKVTYRMRILSPPLCLLRRMRWYGRF